MDIRNGIDCMDNQNLNQGSLMLRKHQNSSVISQPNTRSETTLQPNVTVQSSNTSADNQSEAQCLQLITMLQCKLQPSGTTLWLSHTANQVSGTFFGTNLVIFARPVQLNASLNTWILDL